MTVPFSIEMVIWVAVGGRGTLVGAILGAVAINYAKSLVSEAMPQSWLFIQGGLFILVVTALAGGCDRLVPRGRPSQPVESRWECPVAVKPIPVLNLMDKRRFSHDLRTT